MTETDSQTDKTRKELRDAIRTLLMGADPHTLRTSTKFGKYYTPKAHAFVTSNGSGPFTPLPREQWPEAFKRDLASYEHRAWPGYTNSLYGKKVLREPNIPYPLLHFGYAMMDKELYRCSFFVVYVPDSDGILHGRAIDPMAMLEKKEIEAYHSVQVGTKKALLGFPAKEKSFLEHYVKNLFSIDMKRFTWEQHVKNYRSAAQRYPQWFPESAEMPEIEMFMKE